MNTNLRNVALIWVVPILLGIALATGLAWPHAADSTAAVGETAGGPVQRWAKVSVEVPTSHTAFPAGNGAEIASGQCLICHSAGMVLRQPPLTLAEWTAEINKMRNSFGAPLPADQVGVLARYLVGINGRQQSPGRPSAVDGQGS
jgi:mono/diheme cytochrome c family protein